MKKMFFISVIILFWLYYCNNDTTPSIDITGEWLCETNNGYAIYNFRNDNTFELKIMVIIPYSKGEYDGEYTITDETIKFEFSSIDTDISEYSLSDNQLTIDGLVYIPKNISWQEPTIDEMLELRNGETFRAYFEEDGEIYIVHGFEIDRDSILSDNVAFGTDEDVTFVIYFNNDVDIDYTYDGCSPLYIGYTNILTYVSSSGCNSELIFTEKENGILRGMFMAKLYTSAGTSTILNNGQFVIDTKTEINSGTGTGTATSPLGAPYPELTGDNQFSVIWDVQLEDTTDEIDLECSSELPFEWDNEYESYSSLCKDGDLILFISLDQYDIEKKIYDCSDSNNCTICYTSSSGDKFWSSFYGGSGSLQISYYDGEFIQGYFFGILYCEDGFYYKLQNGYFSANVVH